MSDTPFIIPDGLVLSQDDAGMSIEYDGSIELHATLGGKVARLSSKNGDVTLHIPMNVGVIHAAGQVRASGDVQIDELKAAGATIDGNLKAARIETSGSLKCTGDVSVDSIQATDIDCGSLTATELMASGAVETSGDARIDRGRTASLACGGNLSSEELTVSGELASLGNAQIGALSSGSLSVGGTLKVGRGEVNGAAEVGDDLTGDHFTASGDLNVDGDLLVDEVKAGDTNVGGTVKGKRLSTGDLMVGGDLKVDELQSDNTRVSGRVRARTLTTSDLDIGRAVEAERIDAGAVTVGGQLEAEHVKATSLKVAGDARAPGIEVTDTVQVDGSLDTGELQVSSLIVGGALTATIVAATGAVHLGGATAADRIDAKTIDASAGRLDARILRASESVRVGGIPVRSDVIMAPNVDIDPAASGRISVVESGNEIGPTQIKGCLSLDDLEDLFGNSEQFLAERGLARLGQASPAASPAAKPKAALPEPKPEPEPEPEPEPAHFSDPLVEVEVEDSILSSLGPDSGEASLTEAEHSSGIEVEIDDSDQTLDEPLSEPGDDALTLEFAEDDGSELTDEDEPEDDEDGFDDDDNPMAPSRGGINISDLGRPAGVATAAAVGGAAVSSFDDATSLTDFDAISDLEPISEIDPLQQFDEVSALDAGGGGAAVQIGESGSNGTSSEDDDLFGWADQMLTEVVAQGAVSDPDLEEDADESSEPTNGVSVSLDELEEELHAAAAALEEEEAAASTAELEEEVEEEEEELIEEPEAEPETVQEDPIHGQMQETVTRIVTCYVHTEMPPAVTRLKDLVEARDYTRIRSDITEIWNQLLKFHQKRGMRIQPQVTTTFNTINSLVRKL